jgi:hypothetical protein
MADQTLADLRRVNARIHVEENAGHRAFFEELLDGAFVMRRARGDLHDRQAFLDALAPGGQRACDPATIEVIGAGRRRAVVTCIINVGADSIQNTRLFVLIQGRWRLLAWVNELVALSDPPR